LLPVLAGHSLGKKFLYQPSPSWSAMGLGHFSMDLEPQSHPYISARRFLGKKAVSQGRKNNHSRFV